MIDRPVVELPDDAEELELLVEVEGRIGQSRRPDVLEEVVHFYNEERLHQVLSYPTPAAVYHPRAATT